MDSLKNCPEIARGSRPLGVTRGASLSSRNWLDCRDDQINFEHDDPQVIIIGAGHSALVLAARLKRLSEADLLNVSFAITTFKPFSAELHKIINEVDKDLLGGLERSGFKLNDDPSGLPIKYWREGEGFYFNVGCSELIIDGKFKIKQGQEIDRFEKKGIRFKDGSVLDADIVVLATGYTSRQENFQKIFGSKVANRSRAV
ncbi:hypothetical protein FRB98_008538 [Tulasnella sp. 332]|nr:hypothetical protein FRB98_008538 [Tulasnella sp. 332]